MRGTDYRVGADRFMGRACRGIGAMALEKKAVHFLATDAHDITRRPPILSEARKMVAKNFGEEMAEALVEGNPGAVIRNEPIRKW